MPPGAKKRRVETSPEGDAEEALVASKIVKCLPRNTLETLLIGSVTSGTALTTKKLKACLPEDHALGIHGTGSFHAIDKINDIMWNIFSYCTIKERHVCVRWVCRSWKKFEASIPGLFADLSDDSWVGPLWGRNASRMKKILFVQYRNHIPAMVGLRLPTRASSCAFTTIKKFMAIKNKTENSANLSTLVFSGRQAAASVVQEAVDCGMVGPALKRLCFERTEESYPSNNFVGCVVTLLSRTPKLETLEMSHQLASRIGIQTIFQSLVEHNSPANMGGVSSCLLRVLDLSQHISDHTAEITWADVRLIASKCKQLEVLKLFTFNTPMLPVPSNSSPEEYQEELLMYEQTLASFLADPMDTMPHLKTFSLDELEFWGQYGSDILPIDDDDTFRPSSLPNHAVAKILGWLFARMPALEVFSLGWQDLSEADPPVDTYPGLEMGDNVKAWPRTLKQINLCNCALEANALDHLPPSVEKITMESCGQHMVQIAQNIRARRLAADPNAMVAIGVETYWSGNVEDDKHILAVCILLGGQSHYSLPKYFTFLKEKHLALKCL